MANIGSFDPTSVAPREDFTPIPTGEYRAQIIDSDYKPTKNGAGNYAELTFEIMDGPYKGRRVWARLNLDNPSAKAVEIAERDLSAICHAVGWLKPVKDTQVLHNKPMTIRVEYVTADGVKRTSDTNEIKAYKAPEGGATVAAAPAAAATPAAATGAPPWANKAA